MALKRSHQGFFTSQVQFAHFEFLTSSAYRTSAEITHPGAPKELLEIPHKAQKLKFLWARTVRYEQSRERSWTRRS